MLAYHNKESIKTKYLDRVAAHAAADEIIQGQYWEGGKGCAVGCTIHGSNHSKYETELGVPESLAHLQDALFEALPLERAKLWPGQFLAAIKVGADLSGVCRQYIAWSVRDLAGAIKKPGIKAIVERMATLMERSLAGDEPSETEWSEAARDAQVSWDAWDAWEAWAAISARGARDAVVIRYADKLLELLSAAPIPHAAP